MKDEIIHIYCVPGMAADVSIFEFIKLPVNFKLHTIAWKNPKKGELLKNYAKRMSADVKHKNSILLGVSFGGIMVQEMSHFIDYKKIVLISSVKSKNELPAHFQLVKTTHLYKLLPTSLLQKVKNWEDIVFGSQAKNIASWYQKYLTVIDKHYLDWAIENVLQWKQEKPLPNTIHIHGDEDAVFPIKNIKNCLIIPKGKHAAILRRSRWINEHLPKLIQE